MNLFTTQANSNYIATRIKADETASSAKKLPLIKRESSLIQVHRLFKVKRYNTPTNYKSKKKKYPGTHFLISRRSIRIRMACSGSIINFLHISRASCQDITSQVYISLKKKNKEKIKMDELPIPQSRFKN